MDPVGYKRINKKTGKEIDKDNIVKGIEYEDGKYVVLSAEEIAAAYPRTTQTIEIEAFVDADDVPFVYLERPYYVAPVNKGEKVYALLREALKDSQQGGHRQGGDPDQAAPGGADPLRPRAGAQPAALGRRNPLLGRPEAAAGGQGRGIKDTELKMAKQLIDDMSGQWSADDFRDSFQRRDHEAGRRQGRRRADRRR